MVSNLILLRIVLPKKKFIIRPINKIIKRDTTDKDITEFKGIRIEDMIDEYVQTIPEYTEEEKKIVAEEGKQFYNECI